MPIKVLDKNVSELIAAGEVIERPASIVKELIENSIDAGAECITVEIQNGGRTFLRVTDDGTGIPHDEAPVAFLRHATSKVRVSDDLTAISTLGFRGEALASAAMVSRVHLLTKTIDSKMGTSYKIEGGEELEHTSAGCPDGTTLIIRDLFFNTPARLKFLKKDFSEGNSVQAVFDRTALINPQISFKLIRDNKTIKITPGDGQLHSSIYAIFGKEFATSLIPVEYSQNNISVTGYISMPLFSKSNRAFQYYYVNQRYIRSPALMAAVEEGFKNSIMTGKFPACVLNIEINPADVDVNVHPAKIEVRFVNDRAVFDAVYFAVKNALLNAPNMHEPTPEPIIQETPAPVYIPPKPEVTPQFHSHVLNTLKTEYNTEPQFKHINEQSFVKREAVPIVQETFEEKPTQQFKVIGELFNTYILCEHGENMVLVDKHAADERIRFNKLKHELKSHSQLLLENAEVVLDSDGYNAINDAADDLANIGIDIESGSDFLIKILSMPTLLDKVKPCKLICQIAEQLTNGANVSDNIFDEALHRIACRAAIKAGDKSADYDIVQLAEEVLNSSELRYCPHGRPITVTMSKREIEKLFKRIL
ncbi:MAG: DNA mismatch repair endonuclease MutL [Oscillospiraceae bacterium]|nr:DNA mismatch repair endonuclease MutL [Oscillospiraceae bacterium]